MGQLPPVYNPKDYEHRLYEDWQAKGHFKASGTSGRTPFTILMPPPNVTSQLHMGHGTGYTMQDILVRWKRMLGFEALWLPGTDHAGIATQMMVEKELAKEGKSKGEIGRTQFEERLWEWKNRFGGIIIDQFRAMGFSCDWSRLSFTMDPQLSTAVRKIFVDLFNEGLIYRGERLVNWDPVLKTAISDDEIDSIEQSGSLWYFRYPVVSKAADTAGDTAGATTEFVSIATTRPETMLGDQAVAVNPNDERFQHLIGRQVRLPFSERLIPIIADDYVKSEFGTGCVKITPAHDPNDFAIGQRHGLPMVNIMNDDATLNEHVPLRFQGMPRFEARKAVIKGLKELGLFDNEKSHKNTVPISDRSKEIIEPRLSKQWYVKMKAMAEPAVAAAKNNELKFHPDLWKKTYLHWLENIQDWCISRQLWWGHQLPIWYCQACSEALTGMEDPTKCSKCGAKELVQDPDVLDTWFSSWLWPISPFGWPEETKDLKHFYPTNVLVTAPEIIFLWVARMVMVGQKTQGEIPFTDIFLTATVCDKQGRKMSKTLGNGIDPITVIDRHGTDAVRFTGVHLAPLGGRIRMAEEDFEVGAKFINKIWNASRFLLGKIKEGETIEPLTEVALSSSDAWLLDRFACAATDINKNLENFRINDAVSAIYHLIWDDFCDWGVETAKESLTSNNSPRRPAVVSTLVYVLDGILRLASPVIPFVTEEVWRQLPRHPDWDHPDSLMIAKYPSSAGLQRYEEKAQAWSHVQRLISSLRSVRTQAGLPPKEKFKALVKVADNSLADTFGAAKADIVRLAGLENLEVGLDVQPKGQCLLLE